MGCLDLGISISRPRKVISVLNTERLRSAEEKLRNGRGDDSYTPMKFLQAVRHTFGKTNKRYFDQVHDILADDPGLGGDSDSEVDDEQEDTTENHPAVPRCPVCMDAPLNAVWIPCGHQLCIRCADEIKRGPQVRRVCHICHHPANTFVELRGTY